MNKKRYRNPEHIAEEIRRKNAQRNLKPMSSRDRKFAAMDKEQKDREATQEALRAAARLAGTNFVTVAPMTEPIPVDAKRMAFPLGRRSPFPDHFRLWLRTGTKGRWQYILTEEQHCMIAGDGFYMDRIEFENLDDALVFKLGWWSTVRSPAK